MAAEGGASSRVWFAERRCRHGQGGAHAAACAGLGGHPASEPSPLHLARPNPMALAAPVLAPHRGNCWSGICQSRSPRSTRLRRWRSWCCPTQGTCPPARKQTPGLWRGGKEGQPCLCRRAAACGRGRATTRLRPPALVLLITRPGPPSRLPQPKQPNRPGRPSASCSPGASCPLEFRFQAGREHSSGGSVGSLASGHVTGGSGVLRARARGQGFGRCAARRDAHNHLYGAATSSVCQHGSRPAWAGPGTLSSYARTAQSARC